MRSDGRRNYGTREGDLLALMAAYTPLSAADACERFGWGKRACEHLLRRALREGRVVRVRRGVYRLAEENTRGGVDIARRTALASAEGRR